MSFSFEESLDVITDKAGTLFELPCSIGAKLAGLPEDQSKALTAYGRSLGVAHQLVEDVLDLEGACRSLGFSAKTDWSEGLYSSPVRMALNKAGSVRERLTTLLQLRANGNSVSRLEVRILLRESGAIQDVLNLALESVSQAKNNLKLFQEEKSVLALRQLAEHVATRALEVSSLVASVLC